MDHYTNSQLTSRLTTFSEDGRIFLIDLGSTHGTFLDGTQLSPNKPTVLKNDALIKFGHDSRRPSSWKEKVVTRTKEEALDMIQAFREQIASGAVTFADLAARESHCSSARRGGDLGEFGPGQMQKAFEDATYALAAGELSQPVFSDSGVHLIIRTA
eukprot:gene2538-2840_t